MNSVEACFIWPAFSEAFLEFPFFEGALRAMCPVVAALSSLLPLDLIP